MVVESSMNPYAVNPYTGALGLFQLNNDEHGGVSRNVYARNVKDSNFLLDVLTFINNSYSTGDPVLNAWRNFLPYAKIKDLTNSSFIEAQKGLYSIELLGLESKGSGIEILHPLAFRKAFMNRSKVALPSLGSETYMRETILSHLNLPSDTDRLYFRYQGANADGKVHYFSTLGKTASDLD
jgi:hypothetical protein